jgi:stearoyl-CoA desaturase (delta-9 desaturase)
MDDSLLVVCFQHKYFVPLAFGLGFVLPSLVSHVLIGDALGGYIYGGCVVRLLIWHCTFCINSFAHYIGAQEFSTEMTARGNLILSLLTFGEGMVLFYISRTCD